MLQLVKQDAFLGNRVGNFLDILEVQSLSNKMDRPIYWVHKSQRHVQKMGPTPFMTDYCEHRVPYQLSVRYVSRRRMLSRRAGTLRHHMIESHNLIDKYDFQINFLGLKYRGLLHAAGFCARFSQSDLQCQTQYHLEKRGLREGWYFAFYLGIWRSLSLAHAFLLGRDLGICLLVSELMLFSSSEVPLHNTLLPMR